LGERGRTAPSYYFLFADDPGVEVGNLAQDAVCCARLHERKAAQTSGGIALCHASHLLSFHNASAGLLPEAQCPGRHPRAPGTKAHRSADVSELTLRSDNDRLRLLGLRHQLFFHPAFEALVHLLVRFRPDLGQEVMVPVLIEHQLGGFAEVGC
jgi:hypothetical protein